MRKTEVHKGKAVPQAVLVAGVVLFVACGMSACRQDATSPKASATSAQTENGASAGSKGKDVVSPVTVEVCGKPVTYERVPQRAVTHDVNITELFMFLELDEKFAGYGGLTRGREVEPSLRDRLSRVPEISGKLMNLEKILGASADFVFSGWNYGFKEGEVNPDVLKKHGVDSYVLTESCIRVGERQRVSLDDTLTDLRNLAKIFRIEERVERKLKPLEADLRELERQTGSVTERPAVFVYDSGERIPMTAGRFGMPHAMIEVAGGRNIFDDIPLNWPKANWEDVVERNPSWIIIIDYDAPDAQAKIDFLLNKPELSGVDAIRNRRFFVLTYAQATPGPRNVQKARELARLLHPERVPAAATVR